MWFLDRLSKRHLLRNWIVCFKYEYKYRYNTQKNCEALYNHSISMKIFTSYWIRYFTWAVKIMWKVAIVTQPRFGIANHCTNCVTTYHSNIGVWLREAIDLGTSTLASSLMILTSLLNILSLRNTKGHFPLEIEDPWPMLYKLLRSWRWSMFTLY